jgi:membrane peptidoglycan carboxypeptidase
MNNDPEQERIRKLLRSEEETRMDTPPRKPRTSDPTPPRPRLDKDNLPLPRRVNQIDIEGTRVTQAAFEPVTRPRNRNIQTVQPRSENIFRRFGNFGCILQVLILFLFVFVFVGLCLLSVGVYEYYSIASTLPPINDLQQLAPQFETTRILDRNGDLLYEILDPNAGRRTYVPLSRISPALVAATIATEDKDYYNHPGYDVWAIIRAIWQNYTQGGVVTGASTITQQVVRAVLLNPTELQQRVSYLRKVREILLAAEITRKYSKDQILELYLNENYYGNLSYGVEAAAETYFGTTADKLTLAQASFLAGLPQSPTFYDIYTNRDATLARQQQVLNLMAQMSAEQNCIYVSNSNQPVCVSLAAAAAAVAEK